MLSSGVVAADGLSHQQRKQRLFVERAERIEIPLPHDWLRRREQHDDHDAPEHQPDPVQRADKSVTPSAAFTLNISGNL